MTTTESHGFTLDTTDSKSGYCGMKVTMGSASKKIVKVTKSSSCTADTAYVVYVPTWPSDPHPVLASAEFLGSSDNESYACSAYTSTVSSYLGWKFTVGATSVKLTTVTKGSSCTATKAYLYNSDHSSVLATASFSGTTATFSYKLVASTTYHIVVGSDGSDYTEQGQDGWNIYPDPGPRTWDYITWYGDVDSSSWTPNTAASSSWNVESITVKPYGNEATFAYKMVASTAYYITAKNGDDSSYTRVYGATVSYPHSGTYLNWNAAINSQNWTDDPNSAQNIVSVGLDQITFTKTFTADAFLKKTRTKTFTTDAILVNRKTKTTTTDAIIVNRNTKTFTADAFLEKDSTKTLTADALLRIISQKNFSADALLKKTSTKTTTTDSFLQIKGLLKTMTADAILEITRTKTWTANAVLKKTQTKTLTIDSFLRKPSTKTFTADAFIGKTFLKTTTIDAILVNRPAKTLTVDAIVLHYPILVSPIGGAYVVSSVYLVFTSTTDSTTTGKKYFEIQVDKTSSAFSDIELTVNALSSRVNWQFWDGDSWEQLPETGLDSAYFGNNVRFLAPLTNGQKWWRVREVFQE